MALLSHVCLSAHSALQGHGSQPVKVGGALSVVSSLIPSLNGLQRLDSDCQARMANTITH